MRKQRSCAPLRLTIAAGPQTARCPAAPDEMPPRTVVRFSALPGCDRAQPYRGYRAASYRSKWKRRAAPPTSAARFKSKRPFSAGTTARFPDAAFRAPSPPPKRQRASGRENRFRVSPFSRRFSRFAGTRVPFSFKPFLREPYARENPIRPIAAIRTVSGSPEPDVNGVRSALAFFGASAMVSHAECT
ncbi:Hypothetical protein CINCED_3A008391 [Cinara cedri]|nr:Hypothetical protein CINCED_3A008391 [Cinara cedri]